MWLQICELRAQMSEKEHAMSKLLREKEELCQEKFNLENQLQNCHKQKTQSASPCNLCRHISLPHENRNPDVYQKVSPVLI